jgi:hypothetical protein
LSLYADIVRGSFASDDEVRQDGETWTIVCWLTGGEEIPGFADREMALAVVRALHNAYAEGYGNQGS